MADSELSGRLHNDSAGTADRFNSSHTTSRTLFARTDSMFAVLLCDASACTCSILLIPATRDATESNSLFFVWCSLPAARQARRLAQLQRLFDQTAQERAHRREHCIPSVRRRTVVCNSVWLLLFAAEFRTRQTSRTLTPIQTQQHTLKLRSSTQHHPFEFSALHRSPSHVSTIALQQASRLS